MSDYSISAVGHIQSPYKQKFAIPRQPRLVPQAKAKLIFTAEFNREEFVRGIEEFSHIWLLFRFHETADKGYSAMVRPPRLGGNERKGVFATRATFRPNAIGMSAVKLEGVEYKNGQLSLLLAGIDLLDGTPIVDIKPYLPYSDAMHDASAGFADTRPETQMSVAFSPEAIDFIAKQTHYPELEDFIANVLKQDPRPAYKKQKQGEQSYGMTLYNYNIRWQVNGEHNLVTSIENN
ncbi:MULTISPECIES: tRNA (N6-threonylcarbamoyladenosine(37)-N6)-methyltransferase TrmO [Pseudoalteromonas]|jgi:tRNA-Thr(GGU) m(6)t(6)A37 methyltransferase TsaA|uniref:tRNA-Thr(GGU) m(6)t(6)A37 methyltransferase TsaA n=2 Tax=Pseudoalteromonas TaxID=53246 RepID=A0ABR5VLL7_9GAMM|nr:MULTISPECIES: tRNA (N6-threonylcarbamoyladenosine(37)-N6)-methyltransferase TrmO [Pseudoalteromonas]MDY6886758.1 tRNA (N6-threonylcarbamoyladenosine(37)-N6)-methyltransferase TrmO [Pseudomonadota bacterium]GEK75033.1 tRNA (N6-threonylcarbamoyladenosine(37)-N6)-methyltransferase TrmO [Pseudoalteromonas atlantica]KPW03454.1 putative tRNA (adenine(37)-N6)-methyltransferase [Pseudoalteromonas sp. P1-11]KYL30633.1 tRNA-Thr(GGU) m(6)t(6)A37 methyltransferase TsaA [Pseudoalteromonas telluritireduce|tara:strand:+ start:7592 stop:8296 length:705 start_codon:yes stop_codon:yes gene_type:complete